MPMTRVHRRADLVAHRGEERALRIVGGLGLRTGLPRIVEQPRVLDGDGRLQRESGEKLELGVVERKSPRSPHGHRAPDRRPRHQWRHHQPLVFRPIGAGDLDRAPVRLRIVDVLGTSGFEQAADDARAGHDFGRLDRVRDFAHRDDRAMGACRPRRAGRSRCCRRAGAPWHDGRCDPLPSPDRASTKYRARLRPAPQSRARVAAFRRTGARSRAPRSSSWREWSAAARQNRRTHLASRRYSATTPRASSPIRIGTPTIALARHPSCSRRRSASRRARLHVSSGRGRSPAIAGS